MTVWTFGKIALAVSYRKKQMLNSVTWIMMIHERNKRGPKGHHIMFSTVKGQRSLHQSAMQCYRLCHIISSSSFSCCSFEESDPTVSVIRKQRNQIVKTLGGYWAPLLSSQKTCGFFEKALEHFWSLLSCHPHTQVSTLFFRTLLDLWHCPSSRCYLL